MGEFLEDADDFFKSMQTLWEAEEFVANLMEAGETENSKALKQKEAAEKKEKSFINFKKNLMLPLSIMEDNELVNENINWSKRVLITEKSQWYLRTNKDERKRMALILELEGIDVPKSSMVKW